MTDLQDLAEKTVKLVLRLGASHCDVLATDSMFIVAEIEKSSMKQTSVISDPGVGVRAFLKGASGFSYTTGHDQRSLKRIAELAVSQARAGTHDPDFKDLPGASRPAKVQGLYDKKVATLEPDEVVEMAIELSDSAKADERIVGVNAGVSAGVGTMALANSNGFSRLQWSTSLETSVESVARSGSKMFSGMDGGWGRRLEMDALALAGRNAMEHAVKGLSQRRIPTGDYQVVLDPLSAGYILTAAIGGGVNAESVQRKRSYLEGKLGSRIGSEAFTVYDDPTIEWASGSFTFDGEGCPAKKKMVVDRGILKTYLHDSYTSGKASVENTGNSSRGGTVWSYRRPPSISSSNIVIEKGDSDLSEIVRETRTGVYLRTTFDSPNLATGEFSGLMMEGFLIERGEIGPAIQQSTIGIGLMEMFSRIDMLGKDQREAFGAKVPAMRISHARIAGSG
jgi:PmbA protein